MTDYEQVAGALRNTTWITWCTGATVDDVLAIYGGGRNIVTAATLAETTEAAYLQSEEGTLFLFVGALGDGVVLMEPLFTCVGDTERNHLSQAGVCLDVGWGDHISAHITYRERGRIVAKLADMGWKCVTVPDQETVEQWMSTTPGGLERWQTRSREASLMTAEAIMGAPMDEQWLAREHTCIEFSRADPEPAPRRAVRLADLVPHVAAPVPCEARPEKAGEAPNSPGGSGPPA